MARTKYAILKKKRVNGDEVGKITIFNLIHTWKQQLAGKAGTGFLQPEKFRSMLAQLTSPEDITRYQRYVELNHWTIATVADARGRHAEITQILKSLDTFLLSLDVTLCLENEKARQPVIYSLESFRAYRDTLAAEALENIPDLTGIGVVFYALKALLESDELPRELRKHLDIPAPKRGIFHHRFTTLNKGGYTILETGDRSDRTPPEEWDALTQAVEIPLERVKHSLTPAEYVEIDKLESQYKEKAGRAIMEGKRPPAKPLRLLPRKEKPRMTFQAYSPEDDTDGITLAELVSRNLLKVYYPELFSTGKDTPQRAAELAEVMELYRPEIAHVLDSLEQVIPGIGRDLENPRKTYSVRVLYDADLYGMRTRLKPEQLRPSQNTAEGLHGVAVEVYKASDWKDTIWKTINGDVLQAYSTVLGLERYDEKLNQDAKKNLMELEDDYQTVIEGYYYLLAFDTAVELISDAIEIPEFRIFSTNVRDTILPKIQRLDSRIAWYASDLNDEIQDAKEKEKRKMKGDPNARIIQKAIQNIDDKAMKNFLSFTLVERSAKLKKRLTTLRKFFRLMQAEKMEIPETAKAKARAILDDNLSAFIAQDGRLMAILSDRGVE